MPSDTNPVHVNFKMEVEGGDHDFYERNTDSLYFYLPAKIPVCVGRDHKCAKCGHFVFAESGKHEDWWYRCVYCGTYYFAMRPVSVEDIIADIGIEEEAALRQQRLGRKALTQRTFSCVICSRKVTGQYRARVKTCSQECSKILRRRNIAKAKLNHILRKTKRVEVILQEAA